MWPEQTANISPRHRRFPRKIRPEKRALNERTTTEVWVVLLIGWKSTSSNQKHYPDLVLDTSSVWNFCIRSSDVISRGNHLHCTCMALRNVGY